MHKSISRNENEIYDVKSGTPTLGGRRGSFPLCPHSWGVGGARIALHTELFPAILSAEEAFFGILDSLVLEKFSGSSPQTPKLLLYY